MIKKFPNDAEILDAYKELNSTYKVAKKFDISRDKVKKMLKNLNALNSVEKAANLRKNDYQGKYQRTSEHKKKLSEAASQRTGEKNPFYGKKMSEEHKEKLRKLSKERLGKLNPNYKDSKYLRRPRDYKISEFTVLRNFTFNRDKHTCHYCKCKGGHLHAHHILPYWLCNEAFLDSENLITVCAKCHFEKAHKSNWQNFDFELITQRLMTKYHIHRERLNELASLMEDAIVRTSAINKTDESNRND